MWHTAKAAVPALLDAGGGTIIVVGSGAGRANSGGLGAYSAAKAGAAALTRVLAAELRGSHIAVNELIPGPVLTPAISIFGTTDPDELAEHVRGIGEWLKPPEEVARLALYLAGAAHRRHHRPVLQHDGPPGLTGTAARRQSPAAVGSQRKRRMATPSATTPHSASTARLPPSMPVPDAAGVTARCSPSARCANGNTRPTWTSQSGSSFTGMNTPDTKARITVPNGPIELATSTVVAARDTARPSAHIVAAPTTAYTTNATAPPRRG